MVSLTLVGRVRRVKADRVATASRPFVKANVTCEDIHAGRVIRHRCRYGLVKNC
jgi:hypothetical protein